MQLTFGVRPLNPESQTMFRIKSVSLSLLSIAFALAGCSGEVKSTSASPALDDGVTKGVFYDDGENGCQVYVSIAPSAAKIKNMAVVESWNALDAGNFDVCDDNDPQALGVVSVYGLDDYAQPDWANTTEHFYFKIKDWNSFKRSCLSSDIDCAGAVTKQLTLETR